MTRRKRPGAGGAAQSADGLVELVGFEYSTKMGHGWRTVARLKTASDRLVYIWLVDRLDNKDGKVKGRREVDIAAALGMSDRNLRQCLDRLMRAGWVRCEGSPEERRRGRFSGINVYKVLAAAGGTEVPAEDEKRNRRHHGSVATEAGYLREEEPAFRSNGTPAPSIDPTEDPTPSSDSKIRGGASSKKKTQTAPSRSSSRSGSLALAGKAGNEDNADSDAGGTGVPPVKTSAPRKRPGAEEQIFKTWCSTASPTELWQSGRTTQLFRLGFAWEGGPSRLSRKPDWYIGDDVK